MSIFYEFDTNYGFLFSILTITCEGAQDCGSARYFLGQLPPVPQLPHALNEAATALKDAQES